MVNFHRDMAMHICRGMTGLSWVSCCLRAGVSHSQSLRKVAFCIAEVLEPLLVLSLQDDAVPLEAGLPPLEAAFHDM